MNDQLVAEAATYTTHNKHERQTASAGFEPAIPAIERPQTYALDRSATGIDIRIYQFLLITGHTQKNGAVSKVYILLIPPFFCVCPVFQIKGTSGIKLQNFCM
jgi:hypothetical protein